MLNCRKILVFLLICLSSLFASKGEQNIMKSEQKVIGIIGGTSWESTALYYKLINQTVRDQLGNLNSAKILLYSINYDPIIKLEHEGNWSEIGKQLSLIAKKLQKGGASFVILCCNTLHKVTAEIEEAIEIPFFHIADAAGVSLIKNRVQKVGLLGTQFTMEDGFYTKRLQEKFGLEVIIPDLANRIRTDQIIYHELCQGKVFPGSKKEILTIIQDLHKNGAEAILLGCTELGMLISSEDAPLPIYDTTLLHAQQAALMSIDSIFKGKISN